MSKGDSRLDVSRSNQRLPPKISLGADNLRIESRGYGATLHRHSAGVPHSSNHSMKPFSGPERLSSQHQPNQIDPTHSHYYGSPDPKKTANFCEDRNRFANSSPPRNISKSSFSQHPSSSVQPLKPNYGTPAASQVYSNNRPFNYTSSSGSPGQAYKVHPRQYSGSAGPHPGYSNSNQAQQSTSRDLYSAYTQSSRPQSQPLHFGRPGGTSVDPNQTPLRPTTDNRPRQRANFHSDLVTQL